MILKKETSYVSLNGIDELEDKALENFQIVVNKPFYIIINEDVQVINLKVDKHNFNIDNYTQTGIKKYDNGYSDLTKLITGDNTNTNIIKINFNYIENDVEKLMFFINTNKAYNFTYYHDGQIYRNHYTIYGDNRLPIFYKHMKKWKIDSKITEIKSIQYDITSYMKDGFFINK